MEMYQANLYFYNNFDIYKILF